MLSNIFKGLKDRIAKRKQKKAEEEYQKRAIKNEPENTGSVYVSNAQSWNPETHPEGRGNSYLVESIDYDGNNKKMDVTYRDGYTARYSDISKQEAQDFTRADSKGRWALKNLWDRPYLGVK